VGHLSFFGAPYGAPECVEKLDNLTKGKKLLKGYKTKKAPFQQSGKKLLIGSTLHSQYLNHIPLLWDTTQLRYKAKKSSNFLELICSR